MRNITAVILCGGLGTRLRSVVSDRPKCLAEVNGRPFIYYILDQIADAGIEQVVLCVEHKWEMIHDTVGDDYRDLVITYSVDDVKQGGTGAALRTTLSYIDNSTVLIMNGDTYINFSLPNYIHDYYTLYGNTSFVLNVYNGIVSMGIYLTYRELIQAHIPAGLSYSLEKFFLSNVWEYGIISYIINRPYIDIGTPESYAVADEFMKRIRKGG